MTLNLPTHDSNLTVHKLKLTIWKFSLFIHSEALKKRKTITTQILKSYEISFTI